ncbi:MAG: hypothetical protein RBS57_12130 [Desulforhabdus sp.]|nr:hypothetical protein [Desulforhabdus sp.]
MPAITARPTPFLIKMIRTQVGKESEVIKTLIEKDGSENLYFKVLGKYDVLEFSNLPVIADANKVITAKEILEITTFPCFYWKPKYQKLWSAIADSAAPTLVFLKVHELVNGLFGLSGLMSLMDQVSAGKVLDPKIGSLYPVSGLGHYEVFLWYPADDLESVFRLLRGLRNLTLGQVFSEVPDERANEGVFLDTTTLPLISYAKVIEGKEWEKLQGNVNSLIRVKCAPVNELHIAQEFFKSIPPEIQGTKARVILGEDDVAFSWIDPVPLKNLIPWLYECRNRFGDGLGLLDTTTNLLSTEPISSPPTKQTLKIEFPKIHLVEKLQELNELDGINRYLINELICVVSLINSSSARLFSDNMVKDVSFFLVEYLSKIIQDYSTFVQQGSFEEKTRIEGRLLFLTDQLHLALSQRFPGIETTESESGRPPLATYSVPRIIRAATGIVDSLMGMVIKSKPPKRLTDEINRQKALPLQERTIATGNFKKRWIGFLYFDLAEGYEWHQGQLISLPLSDLYAPHKWITLSHEISHGYYDRVSFPELESKLFQNLSDVIKNKQPQHLELYETRLDDLAWELFAQWFDYSHFYESDWEFYLWSIWTTWLEVPRVFQNKVEYWIRCVFIKICHSWQELSAKFRDIDISHLDDETNGKKRMELLSDQFADVAETLKKLFPTQYSRIEVAAEEDGKQVLEGVYLLYHFAHYFTSYYSNDDLKKSVNTRYKGIDGHVDAIMKGKAVVEKIPNPFLLLREVLRKLYLMGRAELSTSSIVALTYSLWNCASWGQNGK